MNFTVIYQSSRTFNVLCELHRMRGEKKCEKYNDNDNDKGIKAYMQQAYYMYTVDRHYSET